MKKTSLLKLFCSVFSMMLLMPSCLGDGDSSFIIEKDFAYIVSDGYGQKYAVTFNGNIMHDAIGKLTADRCYFIGYKLTNTMGNGFYNAEYVNVLDNGNAIAREFLEYTKPYENSGLINRNDTITPTNVSIAAWSSGPVIGDNWLIAYNMTKKEQDEVKAFFYYDTTNQRDSEGVINKGDNRIVIDLRFGITDKGTSDNNMTNSFSAVGTLASIRNSGHFTPDFSKTSADFVNVPVKFRYQRYTASGQPASVEYIGNWQLGSNNAYYIQFTKQ